MLGIERIYRFFTVLAMSAGASVVSLAQDAGHEAKLRSLIEEGDSLRSEYRFSESLDAYILALQMTEEESYVSADSLLRLDIQDKVLMSENGRSMMNFVDIPDVVARKKFSADEFFLYYPLQDSSWRCVPNQLDSSDNHLFSKATFVKDQDKVVFWSAADGDGIRNIYTSSLRDSVWTLPSLLNEQMTSAGDEIFPMISPDGRSLFFSSTGLYGVGGYDIYVSRWNDDTNDWGAPVNLGFPYSSPADDFLYIDTEDGRYSMFASNRDCSKDSVWVYVLEFDNIPVRRAVEDSQELKDIARLTPVSMDPGSSKTGRSMKSAEVHDYMHKLHEVLSLKDSVSFYSALAAEGRDDGLLIHFKDSLSVLQSEMHKMEMDLVVKGIVVDLDKMIGEEDVLEDVRNHGFSFEKRAYGGPLNMPTEVPEVKFDYSFKILDVAQFAEDQTIPSGVVYQIQIFASKNKATMKSLKGLSPVYESKGSNGHIVYRVGLFRTYADVLGHLNSVKKLGFRNAFISAFIDGKPVTVAKARAKEKETPAVQEFYEVRMIPEGGELDPGVAAGIRQQAAGKDIARTVGSDGTVRYVVGPFADKSKAEDLALFIKAMGVSDVVCGVIKK